MSPTANSEEKLTLDKSKNYLNSICAFRGFVHTRLGGAHKELAVRANFTFANAKLTENELINAIKLCQIVHIFAKWNGNARQKIFEGIVWEWHFSSGAKREISVVAYDPMIRLKQSKDFKFYPAGMPTNAIVTDICGTFGVPLRYSWSGITHEKKVFNAVAASDMILQILEEVRAKTGEKYVCAYRDGALDIRALGTNETVYKFDNERTISTSDKLSLDNLVTRVKIFGKADDDERKSVEAVVDGKLEFGDLQEILFRDEDKTLGAATAEAETLLRERGEPERETTVTVPDLPFLRKGDKIELAAANLSGSYHVLGVSHDAQTRTMSLEI